MLYQLLTLLCIAHTSISGLKPIVTIEKFACFNTVLDVTCSGAEILVFDSGRYGRNNTDIAAKCGTPFQRNCDVVVHLILNRKCAGRKSCAVAVNTELFGDPCGYAEFLQVSYRCVPVSTIKGNCQPAGSDPYFDHSYIASPNYPNKYYMDAECTWNLAVQTRQTIKITIFDFELDVKRDGKCFDYVEIRHQETSFFQHCGALGKQSVMVDSNEAMVYFKTQENSLTQRGFFIYFEAVGPGCSDLEEPANGVVEYEMANDKLWANVSCLPGFHLQQVDGEESPQPPSLRLLCEGSSWSGHVLPCMVPQALTSTMSPGSTELFTPPDTVGDSGSVIGIALGIVSALLLITLLLVLSLYLHRTNKGRRKAERKLDQWRVVINNLQENAINEEGENVHPAMELSLNKSAVSNIRKAKRKKNKNFKEDELQGRNLLSPQYLEDDYDDDYKSPGTPVKYENEYAKIHPPTKPKKFSLASLGRSRDSHLESPNYVEELYGRSLGRQKRARSGVWERNPDKANGLVTPLPIKKPLTQSAPDLLQCLALADVETDREETDVKSRDVGLYDVVNNDVPIYAMARSSTLGAETSHRTLRNMGNRTNSRSKIRC